MESTFHNITPHIEKPNTDEEKKLNIINKYHKSSLFKLLLQHFKISIDGYYISAFYFKNHQCWVSENPIILWNFKEYGSILQIYPSN